MNTEIACINIAGIHLITVTSPELSCEFLKNQDSIFSSRPICLSGELISNNYLTTALAPIGDHYHKMKRILTSKVLSSKRHKWLQLKRDEEADHLVRYIYNQCKDSDNQLGCLVNVRTAARHYCGNVIRKMIFGKRFFGEGLENGGPGFEEIEHVNALFTVLGYLYAFGVSDYIPWLKILDIGGHGKILREGIQSIRKYQDKEIDERIQIWKKGFKTEEEDLLDVLIMLKDENGNAMLTSEEIKAQIIVRIYLIYLPPLMLSFSFFFFLFFTFSFSTYLKY